MKIKNLKMQNFGRFTDFEIEFDGKITNLVGANRAGKTTVGLNGIWAGLKGISENKKNGQLIGERFRFIGPGKATADIEITILDGDTEIKVSNHISKSTNKISFTAPDGYAIDNDWLNNLLSVAFVSAKNFCNLNTREQALLLGMDTEKHDDKIQELKGEYTLLNRDFKSYGEIVLGEKKVHVSISDLVAEKDKINEFNIAQNKVTDDKKLKSDLLVELIGQGGVIKVKLEELNQELGALENRIALGKEAVKKMPDALPAKPTAEIVKQIFNAEEDNSAAYEYERMEEKQKEKEMAEKLLGENKSRQEAATKERLDYISSFDFQLDGLSVDDKGGLLLNNKPIKDPYFSKGEREIIVAKLHASINPDLKVRFIDDFESLDEDNQKKILEILFEKDFQVITATVSKEVTRENSVFLKECKIDDGKEKEKVL